MLTDDEARDLLTRAARTIDVPPTAASAAPAARSRRWIAVAATAAVVAIGAAGAIGIAREGGGDPDGAKDVATAGSPSPSGTLSLDQLLNPRPALPHRPVPLSAPVTTNGTGTRAIEVGPAPEGATGVEFRIACLTAGRFVWPNGGSVECTAKEARAFVRDPDMLGAGGVADLESGQTSFTIAADPGSAWRVVTTFVRVEEPSDAGEIDMDELHRQLKAQSVPFDECADAVAFFQRPDVIEFYTRYFGPDHIVNMGKGRFIDCPGTAQLEEGFARIQEQAATGELQESLAKAEEMRKRAEPGSGR
ncbi:hypothetical protein RB608_17875 [Nocardioides sp. LHD-245]|uniref:hypothetical protein n=1 Tax=Nocardioides sp. LHD-245 TaxID=3051387 RepID=UPI0027DF8801|nr:hypothetical protein [Nocardioides sp. LHD-245]